MRKAPFRRILAKLPLLLLPFVFLIPGCGSVETVKGDVVKVDQRTLASDSWGYRLARKGPDSAILQKVQLCPVQERRAFQEVEVTRESGAVSATAGVGCTVTKIGEISELMFGLSRKRPSKCTSRSGTDRKATGRRIQGEWETVRREVCGVPQPAPPGGKLRLTIIRSRETRDYPVGEGGEIRFGQEEMTKLRIFFTVLRDMEIGGSYNGSSWRQKLSLE